ncbi:MAG: hypothetical protein E3K37_12445 [Candidatus Kuenenia sp.]|nr:hypothetical protein [Candidatus Kuenenia hertensis]
MDTLTVILNEIGKFTPIIKDVVTIVAIIVGIYFGNKGLKKFLLDDIVKQKIFDLHKTNQEVFILTKEIIAEINSKEDIKRPVAEEDLTYIKSKTQKLVNLSNGASKEVATLSFFINETIKGITPSVKSETYCEKRYALDFYSLLYSTVVKINHFSSNIVDVPKKIKLEPYNEITKKIRRFLDQEETYKIKGVQFGLNLNANSALSLLFSSMINKSTHGYIYRKKFFQLLQKNTPIIYELYINNIYLPVIFEMEKEEPFMGKRTLHLVKFEMKQSIISVNTKHTIEFFYSNINPTIKFIDTIKIENFKENYHDTFLNTEEIFQNLSLEFSVLADETIKVICDKNDAENYYKKVRKKLKKKIKSLK